ncbi:DNA/RNA non-specific endonuclease [Acinetobacter sp. SWAC57]|uniref:DNA/RNA non-specific endonuclease n=1 Tax=Acinetobacter sp. SWAC57 TaxID=2293834 RepID=UPI000E5B18FD|nr:DNA/RNA non-specific endonuclease [Acinetobacter sp. SWAC57]RGD93934.1 helicase [Acinetobacter sp. SWAC57]
METTWKKALKSNKAVKVNIQPVYSGTSKRPTSFIVEQNVGGKQLPVLKLKNTATGK